MKVMICRALNEKNEPLWEERYPAEVLMRYKEEAGSVIFALQFQNDPSLCEGSFINSGYIRYYESVPPRLAVHIGVDPAISLSEKADYFAVVVVGEDNGVFYVLKTHQAHLTFKEQIHLLESYFEEHKPVRINIEAVAYQAVLAEALKERGLPVSSVVQSYAKDIRIMRLAALVEAGRIRFDKKQTDIIEQLLSYPHTRHDDLIDALSLAVSSRLKIKSKYLSVKGL